MTATVEDTVTAAEELLEYVGHHIRAYRTRWGWSQQDLANMIGRGLATVNGWECGKRFPSLPDLLAVVSVFGVPITAFLPRGDA